MTNTEAPQLPVIHAQSMLSAGGYTPTKEVRDAIQARADWLRAKWGIDDTITVSLAVQDRDGVNLGTLDYQR
jgi:hypothetical protein